jgi:DNA-binding LytR/AlgR family response regulator
MLRTMITDAPFEQRWILQGRLCGQWAEDLKEKWNETHRAREGRKCIVDLEDVLSIDQSGENALIEMLAEGASLVTARAYMKDVLSRLNEHGADIKESARKRVNSCG